MVGQRRAEIAFAFVVREHRGTYGHRVSLANVGTGGKGLLRGWIGIAGREPTGRSEQCEQRYGEPQPPPSHQSFPNLPLSRFGHHQPQVGQNANQSIEITEGSRALGKAV